MPRLPLEVKGSASSISLGLTARTVEKAGVGWLGYHAFRRGLATNLRALGTYDLTISEILRHSDVKVTRASYIKAVAQKSADATDAVIARA